MVDSRGIQALARRVAAGELSGSAAFDAVVALIVADEIPPGATPQQVAQIRDEVVLGVSHDRVLCEMLFRTKPRARWDASGWWSARAHPAPARRR